MSELGYVRFLADWTNKDPAITKELAKYGRTGVPLYVLIYKDGTVKVLPELLTIGHGLGCTEINQLPPQFGVCQKIN